MSITNTNLSKVWVAATAYFNLYDTLTRLNAQISATDTQINAFVPEADISVGELKSIGVLASINRDGLVSQQTSIEAEIDQQTPILIQYFNDYEGTSDIHNDEGTRAILYDSRTNIISIVNYPIEES